MRLKFYFAIVSFEIWNNTAGIAKVKDGATGRYYRRVEMISLYIYINLVGFVS